MVLSAVKGLDEKYFIIFISNFKEKTSYLLKIVTVILGTR